MAARRGGVMLGAGALAGRSIPCDFVGAPPFPADGDIPALNRAGEANRLDDVGAPFRKVEKAACAEYFDHALFLAVAPYFGKRGKSVGKRVQHTPPTGTTLTEFRR